MTELTTANKKGRKSASLCLESVELDLLFSPPMPDQECT